MSKYDLDGKVAIVTGASRGIGEAIARGFVEAGARVVISSRKPENILPVADSINDQYPNRVMGVPAHTGRRVETISLVELAVEKFERIDIAVNNASTNPHFGPLLSSEESQWDKIFEVNVKGYFWLCQAAALQMIKQGQGGKIINIASIAGVEPGFMMGIYSVSKAAIIMLTKSLAIELGKDNIQVNAIAPGFVRTSFSKALWDNPSIYDSIIHRTPAGRIAKPEEILGITLHLASSASDFTTGAVFMVDGGYTLS